MEREGNCHLDDTIKPPVMATITPEQTKTRILRLPEVMSRVGLHRASIYKHMAEGFFPHPVPLGARAVGWIESEIDAWLAARIRKRSESTTHGV